MKQVTIYKDGQETNINSECENTEQATAWLQHHNEVGSFQVFEKVVITKNMDGEESVEVFPPTHTFEIKDISEELEQARINIESQEYLNSTDWMILRELDSGVLCPLEIKQSRQAARESIK